MVQYKPHCWPCSFDKLGYAYCYPNLPKCVTGKNSHEETEKLNNKNSLIAVRSEIDANPGFGTKVNDSLQPVTDLLNGRFCRNWKKNPSN